VRPADEATLGHWDAVAVDGPGGHVLQSRAWARHRARFGWTPLLDVTDDGLPVLTLTRPWRIGPGGSAYVSRGPIPAGDPALTAARLLETSDWLAARGLDVIAADPEVAAGTEFDDPITGRGFRQIEELQPSRHRMDVPLPRDGDGEALLKSFSSTTRNLVRQAERQGLVVRRIDRRQSKQAHETLEVAAPAAPTSDAPDSPPRPAANPAAAASDAFVLVERDAEAALLGKLYGLLADTARRRSFGLASRATFDSWTAEALEAGHLVALLIETPEGELLAGATFHRHANRLTYALSGESASARKASPGATRLLLWRAMQIAMGEDRAIMDLGGVDVRGARRRPREGEPEHGMLTFKESFGAEWVDLAGAHELVVRPWRYALGRVAARLAGLRAQGTTR
jgi:lipid II:glycine glycyltransferase (peptidoglycan interpeptide bridge formation enzyme)